MRTAKPGLRLSKAKKMTVKKSRKSNRRKIHTFKEKSIMNSEFKEHRFCVETLLSPSL